MRWFIVFLLVANVILFFWVKQESRPQPGSIVLPAPDVGRLRLLNEGSVEQHGGATKALPPPPAGQAARVDPAIASGPLDDGLAGARPGVGDSGATESADDHPSIGPGASAAEMPAADTAATAPATPGWAADQTGRQRDIETDAAAASRPGPYAAPAAPTPFADASPNSEPPSDPVAVVSAVPADAVQPVCARVGPLAAAEADQLVANLPGQLKLLSDVTEEYTAADTYFVMIPPLASRSAGRRKLEELADAGIEDTWLFPSGEYRNAISLGLFRREGGARRHAASLQKKGFAAEVRARTARKEGRWLLLQDAEGGDIGPRLPLPQQATAEQRPCP